MRTGFGWGFLVGGFYFLVGSLRDLLTFDLGTIITALILVLFLALCTGLLGAVIGWFVVRLRPQ